MLEELVEVLRYITYSMMHAFRSTSVYMEDFATMDESYICMWVWVGESVSFCSEDASCNMTDVVRLRTRESGDEWNGGSEKGEGRDPGASLRSPPKT